MNNDGHSSLADRMAIIFLYKFLAVNEKSRIFATDINNKDQKIWKQ